LIAHTIELPTDMANVPISAANSAQTLLLCDLDRLGMDELSVSIPRCRRQSQVRTLNLANLQPLAKQALECSTAQEVRELVKKHFS